ncbi:dTDP-4-dehydrorhamnose reductase [Sediminihabitans luteus]|uniref:dTDP-4-dehydrorhamnose reductase n=1 Tax=Sediminihabitans luteus TaxID=1138585 RepID=A0A2M9CDQ4_9CELL|nr:dTDP-4-dehydrorhamnose reductase [Sediminihabitans luteus]
MVLGAGGLLGADLVPVLARDHEVRACVRRDVDVTDPRAVAAAVEGASYVVNAAAWTAVDDAEAHEEEAAAVNGAGAGVVARACAVIGARLVHVSTDYVFAGDDAAARAAVPYPEDAPTDPRTAYGRTKAAGEREVLAASSDHVVVRTAWLYGAHGPCFPRTIVRVARERGGLDVVTGQRGQPTWTRDVADLVRRLLAAEVPGGVYHATSSGVATWHDLAVEAVRAAGMPGDVVRPLDGELPGRAATRPVWSVLGHDRLRAVGVEPIGHWRDRWTLAADEVLAGVV